MSEETNMDNPFILCIFVLSDNITRKSLFLGERERDVCDVYSYSLHSGYTKG